MKVKVHVFAELKRLLKSEQTMELTEGATLEDLISKLSITTRTFRKGYIGSYKVGSNLTVTVNGQNMKTLETPYVLHDDDVIELSPFSVGG